MNLPRKPALYWGLITAAALALSVFLLFGKGFSSKKVVIEINNESRDSGPVSNFLDFVRSSLSMLRIEEGKITGKDKYPLHKKITSTVFWIGEKAGDDNGDIPNSSSAWDEAWSKHFGGTDDPGKRNGFFPQGFVPKENPFYVALPFNDFDENGKRKKEAMKYIPWAGEKKWKDEESVCKNQWVKITKGDKTVYAQWEDVGPFKENDYSYVFGKEIPLNRINDRAGIDVSPAVRDYLGLEDIDEVDWQFISEKDVPDGDWKKIVTTSQIYWE
jgi:hypothetical protein